MRWSGIIGGLLLALVGGIWILQGLDVAFAPKSFMTSERPWVLYGSVLAAVGLAISARSLWRSRRPRREEPPGRR